MEGRLRPPTDQSEEPYFLDRCPNPTAQRDLLTAAGCDELFIDKASGKLASRPQLDAAMRHLRAGDVLVITRLDRLGRSVKHLAALAVELQERKIGLRVRQDIGQLQ